jgi:hypothetical protein
VNDNLVSGRLIAVFDPPAEETCYINYAEGARCGRPKKHDGPCSQVSRWVTTKERVMTPHRMAKLQSLVTQIIAQEARHLADAADYDQITRSDEEDEFIRAELRRQADTIGAPRSLRGRHGR